MMKTLVKGGLAGGAVLFIWGMISWMVLPWHNTTFSQFQDEETVAQVLKENAPSAGVYFLPNPHGPEGVNERLLEEGPNIFATVRLGGMKPMAQSMVISLLIQILAAMGFTWLLLKANLASFRERVLLVAVTAVLAGVLCYLPYWNWWGFTSGYTFVAIADLVVGGSLTGLVLARIIKT